jgi:hypothetical protein
MEPFIMRFAKSPGNPSTQIPSMRYDTNSEMMIITDTEKRQSVIDVPSIGMATGSYFTKAGADPTADEPTDR